jgi:hypothetical protein
MAGVIVGHHQMPNSPTAPDERIAIVGAGYALADTIRGNDDPSRKGSACTASLV